MELLPKAFFATFGLLAVVACSLFPSSAAGGFTIRPDKGLLAGEVHAVGKVGGQLTLLGTYTVQAFAGAVTVLKSRPTLRFGHALQAR